MTGTKQLEAVVLAQLMKAVRPVIKNVVRSAQPVRKVGRPAKQPASQQREITLPREGGKCRQVWDELDREVLAGEQPTVAHIMEVAEKKGWSAGNARTEFYRWGHYRAQHPLRSPSKAPRPRKGATQH